MLQHGMYLVDVDNDGDPDIIPESGWYFNSNEDKNPNWVPDIFLNNENQRFIPSTIFYPENDKNSSSFIQTRDNGRIQIPN